MNVQFPELLPYLTEEQKKKLTIAQGVELCFLLEATMDMLEEEGHEYDYGSVVKELVQEVLEGEYAE